MGQRLVVDCKFGGVTEATCYYHWSGFTSSTMQILVDIVNAYQANKDKDADKSGRFKALKYLFATGGTLTSKTKEYDPDLSKLFDRGYCDRNEGLIDIDPKEIADSKSWAEQNAIIDFDNQVIRTDAVWVHPERDEFDEPDEPSWIETNGFTVTDQLPDFIKFTVGKNPNDQYHSYSDEYECWLEFKFEDVVRAQLFLASLEDDDQRIAYKVADDKYLDVVG